MADYAATININKYVYQRKIVVFETSGQDRENILLRIELDSTNFNFSVARADGKDFRLCVNSNGSGCLNMFIARWDSINKRAYLFFKLPFLAANEKKVLYAFWGNRFDDGISDLSSLSECFILFDDFFTFDATKWTSFGSYHISNSKLWLPASNSYFEPKDPYILKNTPDWVMEEGVLGGYVRTDAHAHTLEVSAGRASLLPEGFNGFEFLFYKNGSTNRRSNLVDSQTYINYSQSGRGIEPIVFNYIILAYWSKNDNVYQGMKFRTNLVDYYDSWERRVLGNTDLLTFRIRGGQYASSGYSVEIDWFVLRKYDLHIEPKYDLSDLYVPYEIVFPQPLSFFVYGDDVTSTFYFHSTTFSGADPYRISDNIFDSYYNTFVGNSLSGSITIDFRRSREDITSSQYIHFDNNHVEFFNASKLSNKNLNPYDRNYWRCTLSSGVWAAIDFGRGVRISTVIVYPLPTYLDGMIKNYCFYGSNKDPRFFRQDWVKLKSGQFIRSAQPQLFYIKNIDTYRYYILEANDSYGGNVSLLEWEMFEEVEDLLRPPVVSQLRLRPLVNGEDEFYFPKYIKLLASNDGVVWSRLTEPHLIYSPVDVIGSVDIALNKPSSAQSVLSSNFSANKVVDNDSYTSWRSGHTIPQWWGVDLQGVYHVRRISLLGLLSGFFTQSYEFYLSLDGLNWELFKIVYNFPVNQMLVIDIMEYFRYLRIRIISSSGNSYAVLTTVNVYAATVTVADAAYASFARTYTPFVDYTYGRWQRMSLKNDRSFYLYKLECVGNWGGSGEKIKIAEWELVERIDLEDYTYRIFDGELANFISIWPAENSSFETPVFYALNDKLNLSADFWLLHSATISGANDIFIKY